MLSTLTTLLNWHIQMGSPSTTSHSSGRAKAKKTTRQISLRKLLFQRNTKRKLRAAVEEQRRNATSSASTSATALPPVAGPSSQPVQSTGLQNHARATTGNNDSQVSLRIPSYVPDAKYAWTKGEPFHSQRVLRTLRTGATCRVGLMSGIVAGRQITYICKSWLRTGQDNLEGFYSELALYKSQHYLRRLQGDVIPRLISVQSSPNQVHMIMELPHYAFWAEASAAMDPLLKQRCVEALLKIHKRGVLHGNLELHNILIGGDGRVTIVDFSASRVSKPSPDVKLREASDLELSMERRELVSKLHHDDRSDEQSSQIHQGFSTSSLSPDPFERPSLLEQHEGQLEKAVRSLAKMVRSSAGYNYVQVPRPDLPPRKQSSTHHPAPHQAAGGSSGQQGTSVVVLGKRRMDTPLEVTATPPVRKRKRSLPSSTTQEEPTRVRKRSKATQTEPFSQVSPTAPDTESTSHLGPSVTIEPPRTDQRSRSSPNPSDSEQDEAGAERTHLFVSATPRGPTFRLLGKDYLQLRRRGSPRPVGALTFGKGILKRTPRVFPVEPPPEALPDEVDNAIARAINEAINSETMPSDPPSSLRMRIAASGASKSGVCGYKFERRFSGRRVISGGPSVGFGVTSISKAYPLDSAIKPKKLPSIAVRRYQKLRLTGSR
ncbi:hypothetical protein BDW22DRAFT_108758 [Trametopsis cervina]|nr:hypothetical protein BDW22DRAFT_108758 [Trametopsis cervina]